ncbi:ergothioneine biosynthesis glutamate--cysteine ligase EgtA [Streptosporangium sp. NBC_01810]|uniref:ergothioneine biosynthesis glutamate--cysteine ligase EgtA n=1 Tax=Streptosporangium sp. NBC_01810 TaxID=2975951 RepID=UPI002DDAD34B|nr:ergothioneine biosynthesis glutamate--cysteine ligase EgtA [Streptosporangium sp. NBC_01810]WSA28103.1 ergothioneine biosynthesis glutamate--cysteine ligase EgtA [Streptosporangium sp. NBC_01810]
MTGLATENTLIRNASDVEAFARQCFLASPGEQVGVELEFLVFDRTAPARQVPWGRIAEALPRLPGGSLVTFEPGGQLELSGPPGSLPDAITRLTADVDAVREALRDAGLVPVGVGLDPLRPARRQLRLPRYEAMAEFLGMPYGALMMCSTASIQVNLDLGERPATRWERAHLLGPVLVAAFANSPLSESRPCGWMSGRQAVWERLDRTRTAAVPATGDPAADWAEYLLDARLMAVREAPQSPENPENAGDAGDAEGTRYHPVRDGSTFRDLLAAAARPPTLADLTYHATTLFPPVRPRGWLEIRYLDAQHPASWPVCAAVTHALVTDDRAADSALAAAEPCAGMWLRAARRGLADPMLRRAADACFRAALAALPRLGAAPALVCEVASFANRHVSPGRSPAADLLDLAGGPGRRLPDWLAREGRI